MKKTILVTITLLFCQIMNVFSLPEWSKIENLPEGYEDHVWLDVFVLPDNPNMVWICGFNGLILRSNDGGESFQGSITPLPIQLESIHFVSQFVGFCSGPNVVYKSTDGGATWEELFDPGSYNDGTGQPRSYSIWGCYFLDEMTGIAVGGDCLDNKQFFFKTTDGGENWKLIYMQENNSSNSDIILFSESDTAYAVSSGIIWISEDKGESWELLSRTGENDWHEEIGVIGNSIIVPYSVGCHGNGQGGGVRMTTDYGKNWIGHDLGSEMYGAFLHDELRGWVCGDDEKIYYTSDGGKNWIARNSGIQAGDNLDDMTFVNDSLGWCVGTGIYKSKKNILSVENETNSPSRFIHKNPMSANDPISFYSDIPGSKTISLYNQRGEKIETLYSDHMNSGKISLYISDQRLPSGIYLLRVESEQETLSKKIIILK
jgi:photosystem II stability/assembly factor-like uncharacterized protein